jgi:Helix-turn-helix
VAKAVGMSENMLSEIVQGHRKTELGEIVLIAKVLDEDPFVLIRPMLGWHLYGTGSAKASEVEDKYTCGLTAAVRLVIASSGLPDVRHR